MKLISIFVIPEVILEWCGKICYFYNLQALKIIYICQILFTDYVHNLVFWDNFINMEIYEKYLLFFFKFILFYICYLSMILVFEGWGLGSLLFPILNHHNW